MKHIARLVVNIVCVLHEPSFPRKGLETIMVVDDALTMEPDNTRIVAEQQQLEALLKYQ